jgi:hypothetical protein
MVHKTSPELAPPPAAKRRHLSTLGGIDNIDGGNGTGSGSNKENAATTTGSLRPPLHGGGRALRPMAMQSLSTSTPLTPLALSARNGKKKMSSKGGNGSGGGNGGGSALHARSSLYRQPLRAASGANHANSGSNNGATDATMKKSSSVKSKSMSKMNSGDVRTMLGKSKQRSTAAANATAGARKSGGNRQSTSKSTSSSPFEEMSSSPMLAARSRLSAGGSGTIAKMQRS